MLCVLINQVNPNVKCQIPSIPSFLTQTLPTFSLLNTDNNKISFYTYFGGGLQPNTLPGTSYFCTKRGLQFDRVEISPCIAWRKNYDIMIVCSPSYRSSDRMGGRVTTPPLDRTLMACLRRHQTITTLANRTHARVYVHTCGKQLELTKPTSK